MSQNQSTSPQLGLAVLEGLLLANEIDDGAFLQRAEQLGISKQEATAAGQKIIAIIANQTARRADTEGPFDYIVVGSGASGAVVAGRLAENPLNRVLLLEAGGADLKPAILSTESWFLNLGTDVDWAFKAEPSPHVNNRSIYQAAGRALGGSTSINGMVWARGHQHDFDYWEKQSGDRDWGYEHA